MVNVLSYDANGLLWILPFFRDIYEWEVPLVGNLINDLKMVYISSSDIDTRIWSPSLDGLFSSKTFFNVLLKESPSFPQHKIWSSTAFLRVKAFSWVVFSIDKIPWIFFKGDASLWLCLL